MLFRSLTFEFTVTAGGAEIDPSLGYLGTGTEGIFYGGDLYGPVTGPSSFGSGGGFYASSSSGDWVGIDQYFFPKLVVPVGYVSGSSLSTTATWDNASFASLGLTPGTYEWNWGSGADADSLTLQIGPIDPVPEPSSFLLLGVGLAGLLFLRTSRHSPPRQAGELPRDLTYE